MTGDTECLWILWCLYEELVDLWKMEQAGKEKISLRKKLYLGENSSTQLGSAVNSI